ncbi:MAG: tetratricopeptide repeat protein [Candidatus Hodarchaeales archaeon]
MYEKQFEQIEQLIYRGNFNKALSHIKSIEPQIQVKNKELLTFRHLKSTLNIKLGKYDKGLSNAKLMLEESKALGNKLRELDAIILIIWILNKLGQISEGLEQVNYGESILQSLYQQLDPPSDLKKREAFVLHYKGELYFSKGEYDNAFDYYKKSLVLRELIGNQQEIANSLFAIGNYFKRKGKFDQSLDYLYKSKGIYESIGNQQDTAYSIYSIGDIFWRKGELDRSLEMIQKCLIIREAIGNQSDISNSLYVIGLIYWKKGDLDSSLRYHQNSFRIREAIGHLPPISQSLNSIGIIYALKGELDLALEYFQKSLSIYEELDEQDSIAIAHLNIGELYDMKGDNENAIDYLKRALNLSRKIRYDTLTAETLFQLIHRTRILIPSETVTTYLDELKNINEKQTNPVIDQQYRLAKAMIMKSSERLTDKITAQTIFQQISEEKIVKHELTIQAMIHLGKLLLFELETTGSETVLKEVKNLANQILSIAQNQNSHWLLVETYLLQSKLALLELDVKKSQILLTQAQDIADEKGLQKLAKNISHKHDTFLQQMGRWDEFIEKKASLKDRLELAQLKDTLSRLVTKKVDELPDIPEIPAFVLIIAPSGISIFINSFQKETSKKVDDQLIAGFLSAINMFGQEVFTTTGSIDRIKYGEYTVVIRSKEPLLFGYSFKGQSYTAIKKLEQFMKSVKESETNWNNLLISASSDKVLPPLIKADMVTIANKIFV